METLVSVLSDTPYGDVLRKVAGSGSTTLFDYEFALDMFYFRDLWKRVRKELKKEMSESIMLVVAQRISSIMDADQIIVLNEGKVVGQGTHHQLLKECQIYYEIATSQLSEEELNYE